MQQIFCLERKPITQLHSLISTDKEPIGQREINTITKVPDASLNLVQSIREACSETKQIDEALKAQIQKNGQYDTFHRELKTQEKLIYVTPAKLDAKFKNKNRFQKTVHKPRTKMEKQLSENR